MTYQDMWLMVCHHVLSKCIYYIKACIQQYQKFMMTLTLTETPKTSVHRAPKTLIYLHQRSKEPGSAGSLKFFLWPPYVIGQAIHIFILWFLLLPFFFFSLPNLSGRRLDVYHTSTHGVDLV